MLISRLSNLCIKKVASLICSLYTSNLNDPSAKGRNVLLHDLLERMNQTKAEIRELPLEIPASSWSNFPRPNAQGFLDSFLEYLKEKLKCEEFLTPYEEHQIFIVQKELLSLKPLLTGVFGLQDGNEEVKDLWTRIIKLAYRVDYVIDSCFFFDATNWRNMMRLSNIVEEIQFINIELNKSRCTQMCNASVLGDKMNSGGILPARAKNTRMDDVMVGFRDEAEKIIDCLTKGSNLLNIVAIVGMPGQGKTTLAKNVYRDRRVQLYFKKYGWCCISQAYKVKDILMDILEDVNSPVPEEQISFISNEELTERLYRCLKGRTYLIVLDDIWDIGAWYELKKSFPDDSNGSRIIFTSRIRKVALEAKPDCSLHELHPLSFEDSWKLLQLKLSFQDGCPLYLVDIGKQIVKNCKGLPLSIVVIAGLLAKKNGNLTLWEQIAESLHSQIAREGCMDILEISYKHLPDYLKPCFLYLGAFPEDQAILAKKLTELWIAEGFIQKHEMRSLEDVTEEYLMDLVDRSLLLVAKRSSTYGIKRCRVHDLVREFCYEKALEKKFLLVPNMFDYHSFHPMHKWYRLCIRTRWWPFYLSEPRAPTVRTLLFSGLAEHIDAPFFFIRFKFLRVLGLECANINSDIDAIMQLVHLRYLALFGSMIVPSSIVNLSRLEVFRLYATKSSSFLPETMWKMRGLRHLYVYGRQFKHLYGVSYKNMNDDYLVEKSLRLENVETFTSFHFYSEEHFRWQLRRIPNVRKLGVSLASFVRLSLSDFLNELESLNLYIPGKLSPREFGLPSTLRKLTLRGPLLPASMISAIGKLPNLEVLKLSAHFEDQSWDVEDEEFLNLKYLKLWLSDIKQWNVSFDSFTQLQQLLVNKCDELTDSPSRFGELPTLKVIKVFRCSNESVANSALEIVAEQCEYGNVDLQHVISHDTDFWNDEDFLLPTTVELHSENQVGFRPSAYTEIPESEDLDYESVLNFSSADSSDEE